MRALGDEMAAAGRPLEDEELVEYILTSLDLDFNPIVTSLVPRQDSVTVVGDLTKCIHSDTIPFVQSRYSMWEL